MSQSHKIQSRLYPLSKEQATPHTHGPHRPPVPRSWKKPRGLTDNRYKAPAIRQNRFPPKRQPLPSPLARLGTEIQQVAKLGSPQTAWSAKPWLSWDFGPSCSGLPHIGLISQWDWGRSEEMVLGFLPERPASHSHTSGLCGQLSDLESHHWDPPEQSPQRLR